MTSQFALACLLLMMLPCRVVAESTLAVLEFELNDLTLLPRGEEELQRTAALQPMLEEALNVTDSVRIIRIDPAAVRDADAAFGYLFEHSEEAARLGAAHGADWVLVGRLHKPSFLFAYLMARLVDTQTGNVAEDLLVEVKGQQQVVTRKGIERLASKIAARLEAPKTDTSAPPANAPDNETRSLPRWPVRPSNQVRP